LIPNKGNVETFKDKTFFSFLYHPYSKEHDTTNSLLKELHCCADLL